MPIIERIVAREILDSRGRPTVAVTCGLRGGAVASASVPSGASTGAAEALELRDGDPARYRGLGCRKAVANVDGPIAKAILGQMLPDQISLDTLLIDLDGTPNKSKLGANAILAVSLAFARACAAERKVPLYQHFADMIGQPLRTLPRPTINLFSGGKHAGGQMPIQDILLVPTAATIDQCLADTFAVFYAAADLTSSRYQTRPLRADEGGLAPPFASIDDALTDAVESIRRAKLEPGKDVGIALDVASSHFFDHGFYNVGVADPRTPQGAGAHGGVPAAQPVDSLGMIEIVRAWVRKFPIVSVEDALAEEDWGHWPALKDAIGKSSLVLGDDFLCTNPRRIRMATDGGCCSALLLKVNQIGTLTEAAEARRLAKDAGWMVTVSARSGETEDNWLADLAVAWGDQIKIGSITQSERLAKYNRLLEIEAETGLPVVKWPG
ncbi:phosphopyruvate hydratase [Humisphaera borealis]|uniref:Enolase n=1 Tax=Humisphaera borealis TaxID=2807512 RepID=A0A7M2WVY6_9BACT|nr:enolase [Humisphaera borealis]QOV89021.1 phosphopyruvate hydratase [Humisphaera borealis]